jgi:hypothetical protein
MLLLNPLLMLPGDQLDKLLQAASSSSSNSDGSSNSPPEQQLLGWFSYRPGTPCTPSMREAAVCQKLQAWTANNSSSSSQQPVVFGLVTSQPDHNAATISLQYKFFRVKDASSSTDSSNAAAAWAGSSGGFGSSSGFNSYARHEPEHPLLQPLHLSVHNLSAGQAAAAAAAGHAGPTSASSSNKWGSASLPALAAVLQPAHGAALSQQQVQQLQQAASAQAGAALQAVQGLYDSLLDELQVAAAEVRLHW